MRNLTERERTEVRDLVEQLDRAIKRDAATKAKADRREKDAPVLVERRTGRDRRNRK